MSGLRRAFRSINLVHPRVKSGAIMPHRPLRNFMDSYPQRESLAKSIKSKRKISKQVAKRHVLRKAAGMRKYFGLKGVV
jgi:hypothetical protein